MNSSETLHSQTWNRCLMGTQHLTVATTSFCELFHESELYPDEILTILQSLEDNNNNNIFDEAAADPPGPVTKGKNSTKKECKKRKKPAKSTSSSSMGLCSDEYQSDEGHAVLKQRKSIKRQEGSLSPPATSMEDEIGEDGSRVGKVVSHIAVERNRRKQMNEHLAVLRQLMPCFYVKKGDQASVIGGVIDYINELHLVLQSLEAKKRRKIYTGEVGPSPRIASSPRFSASMNPSTLSPRKPQIKPRSLINFPVTPRTPQSTSSYYKPPGQPMIQPSSTILSPIANSDSCSSIVNMLPMMNSHDKKGVANERVASSKSNFADVEVKFCGPNLELKTQSSKIAGQTVKMVSAIEDLPLEILKLSINIVEETMLNAFTIQIGIDCELSAEELVQKIQQTFC